MPILLFEDCLCYMVLWCLEFYVWDLHIMFFVTKEINFPFSEFFLVGTKILALAVLVARRQLSPAFRDDKLDNFYRPSSSTLLMKIIYLPTPKRKSSGRDWRCFSRIMSDLAACWRSVVITLDLVGYRVSYSMRGNWDRIPIGTAMFRETVTNVKIKAVSGQF